MRGGRLPQISWITFVDLVKVGRPTMGKRPERLPLWNLLSQVRGQRIFRGNNAVMTRLDPRDDQLEKTPPALISSNFGQDVQQESRPLEMGPVYATHIGPLAHSCPPDPC